MTLQSYNSCRCRRRRRRPLLLILAALITIILTSAQAATNYNYCGDSWISADTYCETPCPLGTSEECPGSQICYASCTNCPAVPIPPPSPAPPPAPPQGATNYNYCGDSWISADTYCDTPCPLGTSEECPANQICYASCTNCPAVPIPPPSPAPPPPPPPPAPPQGATNYNYCGSSWAAANLYCQKGCPGGSDVECDAGEICYADCTNCPAVSSPPPAPPAPSPSDSRLVAYLRNWEDCPTLDQVDGYTHIVISAAVTYDYNPNGNLCSDQCTINTLTTNTVPVCNNQHQPELINLWKSMGIKVLLSFGGSGMGLSVAGDVNNCWDDCFDKETDTLTGVSTQLADIVSTMNLDGVDVDYQYCYEKDSGLQIHADVCEQVTDKYTDEAAINFLTNLTINLRALLDALGDENELIHSPRDVEFVSTPGPTSFGQYYDTLQTEQEHLDFIIVRFYNGASRPVPNGFTGGSPDERASDLYIAAVDAMAARPEKVVFGFCISDCGPTGSNASGEQAVAVLQDIKNDAICNGGAMLWMAQSDVGGAWSDLVWAEVSQTTGCALGPQPTQSPTLSIMPSVSSVPSVTAPEPVTVYNHNYCGSSWAAANLYCGKGCPDGSDDECDAGEICYADCTNCPPVVVGTKAPTKSPITAAPFDSSTCATYRDTVNFGYYQEWATYRSASCNPLEPDEIDVAAFGYTHLAFSFAGISSLGVIEPYNGNYWEYTDKYRWFNSLKESNPDLKTLIAVGGWTFDQSRFVNVASTPTMRANFAQSVVEFLDYHGFDGIDIDWEYPVTRQGTPDDYDNYPLLCEALRKAFDDAGHEDWLITIATAINWNDRLEPGYDLVNMAPHVSWFNVMSYDIYGAWDSIAGANADMPYIENTMSNIFALGIPREKLVFGLAAYGRSTRLASPSCHTAGCQVWGAGLGGCHGEAGNLPYFEIMQDYVETGDYDELNFNPVSKSMELITGGYQYFTSFDNALTLKIKKDYAYDQCLRGVMWWAVDLIIAPIDYNFPTQSPTESQAPSAKASEQPSSEPSISLEPSEQLSEQPSSEPSKSSEPSQSPSESFQPSESLAPSLSGSPTNSCGTACPPGSNGLMVAIPDCYGFFYCTENGPSQVLLCPSGTLFDESLDTCNWATYVTSCSCVSPTPRPSEVPSSKPSLSLVPSTEPSSQPSSKPSLSLVPSYEGQTRSPTIRATPRPSTKISVCEECPPTGWHFVSSSGCTGFFHCLEGVLGSYQMCAPGTRFDSNGMFCDYESRVTCNCYVDPQPNPPPPGPPSPPGPGPPPPPTPPPTPQPTPVGGFPWYPDWDITNECVNDGRDPYWMRSYLTDTKLECCKNNYWWREQECLLS